MAKDTSEDSLNKLKRVRHNTNELPNAFDPTPRATAHF